ncbi:MAG: hypothetical protein K6E78_06665, partial [Treponema sp.]|nr:hypothetical protein [Treponema sp.]
IYNQISVKIRNIFYSIVNNRGFKQNRINIAIVNQDCQGYVTDPKFIERYCDETEYFLLPMALEIDYNMYSELIELIMTRRRYLEDGGYFCSTKKDSQSEKNAAQKNLSEAGNNPADGADSVDNVVYPGSADSAVSPGSSVSPGSGDKIK